MGHGFHSYVSSFVAKLDRSLTPWARAARSAKQGHPGLTTGGRIEGELTSLFEAQCAVSAALAPIIEHIGCHYGEPAM